MYKLRYLTGILLVALAVGLIYYWQSQKIRTVDVLAMKAAHTLSDSEDQNEFVEPFTEVAPTAPDLYYSEEMKRLVGWLEAGRPLDLKIGELAPRDYSFRRTIVTTGAFKISNSPTEQMPASWAVYDGRELLPTGQLGEAASLAVVNDALSMAVTIDGVKYLVETDPETEALIATQLKGTGLDEGEPCDALTCSHFIDASSGLQMHGMKASDEVSLASLIRLPVVIEYAGNEEAPPEIEAAWVDHPYFRLGPEYDASLKDIIVLMVSGSTQTGSSANLSSRAATYLTIAARVADTYERQLGLRYLLQELVLIANDSGQDDIEYDDSVTPNNSNSGTDDLGALESWCDIHRPRNTYGWGHVAGWTLVDSDSGSTVGWAWLDSYGSLGSAFSVQERNFDWDVHSHELGHNVGASHTSGGVMNGSLSNNNENFFTENDATGGYTAAMDIYNYMSSPSRNRVFGPADLRHPEEMPFGQDDTVLTPVNTILTFDPLANDDTSVLFGAVNLLRLVEVGQVFPRAAGSAEVIGNEIRFTPSFGFTGNVWLSYTLAGDVGNAGNGWMHAADVVITVGGDNSDPGQSPALSLRDDDVDAVFSGEIRLNPLLNDEGSGRLWAGDVDVLSQINGTAESYSEDSLYLVGAIVLSGNGTVALETRAMTRDAVTSIGNTGYLVYTPGVNELDVVTIQYTVQDANGNQDVGTITLNRLPTVSISVDIVELVETEGRVATISFNRSGNSDTSVPEEVTFQVSGEVDFMGNGADVSLAGFDSFNPATRTGTFTIPAGLLSSSLFASAYPDGATEGVETLNVEIIDSESLLIDVDAVASVAIIEADSLGVLIYEENFDAFTEPSGIGSGAGSSWINESGEAALQTDWEVQSGSTVSSNTGPNVDNTSGSGKYLYIEASSNNNRTASLLTPSYDLSALEGATLEFAYHMFGSTMGDLHLDVRVNEGAWQEDLIGVFSGQQSVDEDDWKVATVDITAYAGDLVQFRFRGITGSNFLSDICIDDFEIYRPLVEVSETPDIIGEPLTQNLELSDPLYLGVVTQSYPSASYQWKLNGTPLVGATLSTYYVETVDVNDAGIYSVDVSSGLTVTSRPVLVSVGSAPVFAYDQDWKDQAFGLSENGADTNLLSDYNNDGRLNIIDYAFRIFTASLGDEMGKLPSFEITENSSDAYAEITFRRMINGTGDIITTAGYSIGGVNYVVEHSETLASNDWESGTVLLEMVGSPLSNGDGTETVTVRLKAPLDSVSNTKGFLRIKLE